MNFQQKVFDSTADLRTRAAAFADATLATARERATLAADRAARLKVSLATLKTAGRELRKVAAVHVSKFVEQNSALARAAGKDVSALARSTYQMFTEEQREKATPARKSRKVAATRKRAPRARQAAKVA